MAVAELLRQHGGRVLPPLQKESPAFPVSPGTSKPAIHTAASNGDRAEVERLLTENMELLKARDPEGLTPLQCAVRAGSREVADLLRSKGARIEDLRTAVALGELETIKELLKLGAPVNEQDSKGVTPLHTACIYGQVAAAELLLDAGARPNAASWGRDGGPRLPLVHAVSLGQVEMVDLLLMRGATVWADNPLYLAADRGFVEIAERLVTAGADVNVLYAAVSSDRLDMVKFLIAHGADVNTRSRSITPLWQATLTGSEEIVEVLLAAGAEVNTTLSEQQIAGGGVADIFWSLPLHGVTASGKYSPLHVAVWLGHRAIAQRLLAHGATPDIPIATGLGDLEAVAAYLAAGNDLNRLVEPGRMPLLSWARTREVVEWLIGHGADVNARGAAGRLRGRSEGGYTALHEAVKRGDAAMVTVLLEKGADVNAISYEDRTPLELALLESKGENKERVERREAVAELLRQHGGRVLPP